MLWSANLLSRLVSLWKLDLKITIIPGFSMASEGFWECGISLVVLIKMGCLQKLIYSLFLKGLWWRVVRDHFNLSSVAAWFYHCFIEAFWKRSTHLFWSVSTHLFAEQQGLDGGIHVLFFVKRGKLVTFFLGVASFCKFFIELNITFFAGLDDPIAVSVKDLPQASSAPIGRKR